MTKTSSTDPSEEEPMEEKVHNAYARIKTPKGYYHLDRTGAEPLYDARYVEVERFSEGFACVTNHKGESFHIRQADGKPAYRKRFRGWVLPFTDGVAYAFSQNAGPDFILTKKGDWVIIDTLSP